MYYFKGRATSARANDGESDVQSSSWPGSFGSSRTTGWSARLRTALDNEDHGGSISRGHRKATMADGEGARAAPKVRQQVLNRLEEREMGLGTLVDLGRPALSTRRHPPSRTRLVVVVVVAVEKRRPTKPSGPVRDADERLFRALPSRTSGRPLGLPQPAPSLGRLHSAKRLEQVGGPMVIDEHDVVCLCKRPPDVEALGRGAAGVARAVGVPGGSERLALAGELAVVGCFAGADKAKHRVPGSRCRIGFALCCLRGEQEARRRRRRV